MYNYGGRGPCRGGGPVQTHPNYGPRYVVYSNIIKTIYPTCGLCVIGKQDEQMPIYTQSLVPRSQGHREIDKENDGS